jgi:hypothetical protein
MTLHNNAKRIAIHLCQIAGTYELLFGIFFALVLILLAEDRPAN